MVPIHNILEAGEKDSSDGGRREQAGEGDDTTGTEVVSEVKLLNVYLITLTATLQPRAYNPFRKWLDVTVSKPTQSQTHCMLRLNKGLCLMPFTTGCSRQHDC